jgi:hypothetical protein
MITYVSSGASSRNRQEGVGNERLIGGLDVIVLQKEDRARAGK